MVRCNRSDDGFSLVELMVVVLVMAVLMAIAIPTYLASRRRAQDRAVQSSLKHALVAAKAQFTDRETYAGVSAASIQTAEPGLIIVDAATFSNSPTVISVDVITTNVAEDTFVAAGYSRSGTCFYVRDVGLPTSGASNIGTTYASKGSDGTDCRAGDLSGLTFRDRW